MKPRRVHALQNDEMDCGAACICAISKSWGRNFSLARVRNLIGITKDGASMLMLRDAAEKLGFKAEGMLLGYDHLLTAQMPSILLFHNHFAVIYEADAEGVLLSDPAETKISRMSREDLMKKWRGFALLLSPTDAFFASRDDRTSLLKYARALKVFWKDLIYVSVATLLIVVTGIAFPVVMKNLFDGFSPGMNREAFKYGLLALALLGLFGEIQAFLRARLMIGVVVRINRILSTDFMKKLYGLPYGYFTSRQMGEVLSRYSDLHELQEFFTASTIGIIFGLFTVVAYFVVFASWSAALFLALIMICAFNGIIFGFLTPKIRQRSADAARKKSIEDGIVIEGLNSLLSIKLNNLERHLRWRWAAEYNKKVNAEQRAVLLYSLGHSIFRVLQDATVYGIAFLAIAYFGTSKISIGQIVALISVTGTLFAPVQSILFIWDDYTKALVSASRVDDLMETAAESMNEGGRKFRRVEEGMDVSGVFFSYGATELDFAVREVSFEIKRGRKVALVGESGSGKSTLLQLLSGVLKPDRGAVILDGGPLGDYDLSSFRSRIGCVSHALAVFSGSIAENISLGDDAPNMTKIENVARLVCLDDFIDQLSDRYHTKVGSGGRSLSGGQKQKLILARALYRNPEILFLDEATSAIDLEGEAKIVDGLLSRRDLTVIAAAHRVTAIRRFDLVCVMANGSIVERGRHDELLARSETYRRLAANQSRFYESKDQQ